MVARADGRFNFRLINFSAAKFLIADITFLTGAFSRELEVIVAGTFLFSLDESSWR